MSLPNAETLRYYSSQFNRFEKLVESAHNMSFGMSGVLLDHTRQGLATVLFTKLTTTAQTILAISPNPASDRFIHSHLDFTSGAALSRVMVDTMAMLLHMRVRQKMDVFESENDRAAIAEFHSRDLKERLARNEVWKALPDKEQKHLLKKNSLLHSPEVIFTRAEYNYDEVKRMYAYWSAHTHCDPVAFFRMPDQGRGNGQVNDADLGLLGTCLEIVGNLVDDASNRFEAMFPGAESRARAYLESGAASDVASPPPWRGKKLAELE